MEKSQQKPDTVFCCFGKFTFFNRESNDSPDFLLKNAQEMKDNCNKKLGGVGRKQNLSYSLRKFSPCN